MVNFWTTLENVLKTLERTHRETDDFQSDNHPSCYHDDQPVADHTEEILTGFDSCAVWPQIKTMSMMEYEDGYGGDYDGDDGNDGDDEWPI